LDGSKAHEWFGAIRAVIEPGAREKFAGIWPCSIRGSFIPPFSKIGKPKVIMKITSFGKIKQKSIQLFFAGAFFDFLELLRKWLRRDWRALQAKIEAEETNEPAQRCEHYFLHNRILSD
jgi:hypothetical protein